MASPIDISVPISGGTSGDAYADAGDVKFSPVIISQNSFLIPLVLMAVGYVGFKLWKKVRS